MRAAIKYGHSLGSSFAVLQYLVGMIIEVEMVLGIKGTELFHSVSFVS